MPPCRHHHPEKTKPPPPNLGPVRAILVIIYAKDISCLLLWIMGSEQNEVLHFDLSVWMLQAGMQLSSVFKWERRAISKSSKRSLGSSWTSDKLLMHSLSG